MVNKRYRYYGSYSTWTQAMKTAKRLKQQKRGTRYYIVPNTQHYDLYIKW